MGNDGGSIPTRRELVKEAARNPTTTQVKELRNEQQGWLWSVDPLSSKPLAQPVVSDALGRLFNKDSVIQYLLPSDEIDSSSKAEQQELVAGAFKSLKDVVEVKFEIEDSDDRKKNGATGRTERWICPVTRQELGPGSKAVYLVPCGHAFSGSAVREISGEQCLQCNAPYASNDIIPILPTNEEDIARLSLRQKNLADNGLTHSLKKAAGSKKRKKAAVDAGAEAEPSAVEKVANADAGKQPSKESTPQPNKSTKVSEGIKNTSTASLTAKVLQEQDERNKRRKTESNDNISSLFTKHNHDPNNKQKDINFMNRGYAIAGRK